MGLQRATATNWGTMRLRTVGRRSGVERTAILGYFEDGPNLVTMAMNGWADPDPAWWLNLQANPDTSVDLADGSRAVHARAADPDERPRLWARWAVCDKGLDAFAARRSRETAVVILEPRPVQPGNRTPSWVGSPASPEGRERAGGKGNGQPRYPCRLQRPSPAVHDGASSPSWPVAMNGAAGGGRPIRSAASPRKGENVAIRDELDAINAGFGAAFVTQDAERLAAFYADDARLLFYGQPIIRGRAAIDVAMRDMVAGGPATLRFVTDEVIADGSLIVDIGRIVSPTGQIRYVVVHQRQADGSLRIVVDATNADGPPSTAG